MGGEKFSSMLFLTCSMGSPPRGRGKEAVAPFPLPAAGITPAWAGKRTSPHLYCELSKDHPRVGGEKSCIRLLSVCIAGSPPRGRGKVDVRLEGQRGHGITPAWAGKSLRHPVRPCRCGDHPRVGGEKATAFNRRINRLGSPPRGRGKVCLQEQNRRAVGSPPRGRGKGCFVALGLAADGITPAWAGKRRIEKPGLQPAWDHPRVGGEKFAPTHTVSGCWGSPPRGRGKVLRRYAFQHRRWDHPRVGGEKQIDDCPLEYIWGSPPRGRGKVILLDTKSCHDGITPAWAGKRLKSDAL